MKERIFPSGKKPVLHIGEEDMAAYARQVDYEKAVVAAAVACAVRT